MTFGFWTQRRKAAARQLDQATKPILELLETRVMMSMGSTHPISHMGMPETSAVHSLAAPAKKLPAVTAPAASTGESFAGVGLFYAAPQGFSPDQIRHLYGLDQLDAYDPAFPLYTNTGQGQTIVIIGTYSPQLSEENGNLDEFDKFYNISGLVKGHALSAEIPAETLTVGPGTGGGGGGGNRTFLYDPIGAIDTALSVEWAHAMAPNANIELVEVNSLNGVVSPSSLQAGIRMATTLLESGVVNRTFLTNTLGGVVSMALATTTEDPIVQQQYDALFSSAAAANISFIAAAGDTAGARSMPALSPFVTSVGGTLLRLDGAGNRISESAYPQAGGGQSYYETLPAFQQGIKIGRAPLTSRGGPDVALVAIARSGGLSAFFDTDPRDATFARIDPPGPNPLPWVTVTGTSDGTPIFAGIVAAANELRDSLGLPTIGVGLNAALYGGNARAPKLLFTDITTGNNSHQAVKGFDLATGLGSPRANNIIPALGGVIASLKSNATFLGTQTLSIRRGVTGSAIVAFRGTGSVVFGPQNIGLQLTLRPAQLLVDASATLNVGFLDRALDDSLSGMGTVTVINHASTPTLRTVSSYSVLITGQEVGFGRKSRIINGKITTVDGNGNPIPQGSTTFNGTFTTT